MVQAIKKLSAYWYTPDGEPEENPTRFRLQPLDGEQHTEIITEGVQTDEIGKKISARGVALALKYGLVDWENFSDGEQDIKFAPVNFKYIPWEFRLLLASEIVSNSTLEDDLRKKSS